MRLEDLKKDMPKTPEHIHHMIEEEVKKQLAETKVLPISAVKNRKWTHVKVAAVAGVCILATSSVVYAGAELYHSYLNKQGNYQISTGISSNTNVKAIPEKIHDIEISAGYIPEGMEWKDEFHLQYADKERIGGFNIDAVLMDTESLDKTIEDKNVVDSEERVFGNYEGVYLRYHDFTQDGSFNQRVYLFCPELYRVITIYIGDDITKEEAMKVVENLEITETDALVETSKMYTWSKVISPTVEKGDIEKISVADTELLVHQIGDVFDVSASGEDSSGNYMIADIKVQVDKIQIADDLQLLEDRVLPEEWKGVVSSEGKLKQNAVSYIQSGDGVDTLDKITKTENVNQKLVYATVTYTNDTDKKMEHICYLGSLMLMNHENGMYQMYYPWEASGEGYDRLIWTGAARTGEMMYYSVSENGKNYISSLQPGESIQVHMAWIVNEDDLEHMYLNLNTDGVYTFSDDILKHGLVDIRQQNR